MKVAVIGSGGREHTIIKKLKESAKIDEIFAIPGNGETFSLPNNATKNAAIAAIVVDDIASANVTTTLESTPGILPAFGNAGGKKSLVTNETNASELSTKTRGLKPV